VIVYSVIIGVVFCIDVCLCVCTVDILAVVCECNLSFNSSVLAYRPVPLSRSVTVALFLLVLFVTLCYLRNSESENYVEQYWQSKMCKTFYNMASIIHLNFNLQVMSFHLCSLYCIFVYLSEMSSDLDEILKNMQPKLVTLNLRWMTDAIS